MLPVQILPRNTQTCHNRIVWLVQICLPLRDGVIFKWYVINDNHSRTICMYQGQGQRLKFVHSPYFLCLVHYTATWTDFKKKLTYIFTIGVYASDMNPASSLKVKVNQPAHLFTKNTFLVRTKWFWLLFLLSSYCIVTVLWSVQ